MPLFFVIMKKIVWDTKGATELKQTLAVTLLDIKTHRATERNMVIYSIGKALTKKYVFGY